MAVVMAVSMIAARIEHLNRQRSVRIGGRVSVCIRGGGMVGVRGMARCDAFLAVRRYRRPIELER